MSKIVLPANLKRLLNNTEFDGPLQVLIDRVSTILSDNKLYFFPDYTDHGVDHINNVLKSEVDLIPNELWQFTDPEASERLLTAIDSAVIIGATLLHDIAMHLHPTGLTELVGKNSRFRPVQWFSKDQPGYSADKPWDELWEEYCREARRFSDHELAAIIGERDARVWRFNGLPREYGQWTLNDRLVIGEFIRRHHARLSHEIALYGFPGLKAGLGDGDFPSLDADLGKPLHRLADIIGITARSHGTSLRVCKAYFEENPQYQGTPRPLGCAALYAMALLRVADYLQIDHQRAPPVLLQLRSPQSPTSVREWAKHLVIDHIGAASVPRAKHIAVSENISLVTYLQLTELVNGLQNELDQSTAVLDEFYGLRADLNLDKLKLSLRRVYSNINLTEFRGRLPYLPEKASFSADPHLLTLLVEPLYGRHPGVAIRELIQNATDAVRERDFWCSSNSIDSGQLNFGALKDDVLVHYIKDGKGDWFVRVSDRGIGMTDDVIINYFLRAGASFRQSTAWAKEFMDDGRHSKVLRSGRVGVGAFAIFLLGPTFSLKTRHIRGDVGYVLQASINSQVIEIKKDRALPFGTEFEIPLTSETVKLLELEARYKGVEYFHPDEKIDWYCWDYPRVTQIITQGETHISLKEKYLIPINAATDTSSEWHKVLHREYDGIYWSWQRLAAELSVNGIEICHPSRSRSINRWWKNDNGLRCPAVAVKDLDACFPLNVQRYDVSSDKVSFVNNLLRDVILSYIAQALIPGPKNRYEALRNESDHPLCESKINEFAMWESRDSKSIEWFENGLLRWCTTNEAMVPADPALVSSRQCNSYIVFG